MLDGRVLGASQVEYKPFGKPPLKREVASSKALQHKCHLCSIPAAPLARIEASRPRHLPGIEAAPSHSTPTLSGLLAVCAICAIWVLHAKLLAISTICAILLCTRFKMYYMCYTRRIWYMLEMLCA